MAVNEPISAKLTLARSLFFFVKDSYSKLNENPTNGLVATARRRQTDRQTDRQTGAWTGVFTVYGVHLLLCKKHLQ